MEPFYTFHLELKNLNKKLLSLCAQVEERVRRAASIIKEYDEEIARSLILTDYEIDEQEVEIEEDCLKILALHQPVASDLRFIITVIKINNELERIGDYAVNIALRAQEINRSPSKELLGEIDFTDMTETVTKMLKDSLDALINRDASMARQVFVMDEKVDAYRDYVYRIIKDLLREEIEDPAGLLDTYLLARHLERVGDRTTNIAEDTIYLVDGVVARSKE